MEGIPKGVNQRHSSKSATEKAALEEMTASSKKSALEESSLPTKMSRQLSRTLEVSKQCSDRPQFGVQGALRFWQMHRVQVPDLGSSLASSVDFNCPEGTMNTPFCQQS